MGRRSGERCSFRERQDEEAERGCGGGRKPRRSRLGVYPGVAGGGLWVARRRDHLTENLIVDEEQVQSWPTPWRKPCDGTDAHQGTEAGSSEMIKVRLLPDIDTDIDSN
jgi:hypothetical protein